jgi:hypothetical protein
MMFQMFCSGKILVYVFFNMKTPPCTHLDVVAANVLVLEVVCVLPHVDAQQRDEAWSGGFFVNNKKLKPISQLYPSF